MTCACGTCIQVMNRYEDVKDHKSMYRKVAFREQDAFDIKPAFKPGSLVV